MIHLGDLTPNFGVFLFANKQLESKNVLQNNL